MNKPIVLLATSLFLLSITTSSFAQGSIQVNAGLTFPVSDFAYEDLDDRTINAGGASVGFHIGGTYSYDINDKGVGVFVSADFIYNSLKSEAKDLLEAEEALISVNGSPDFTYYRYINIPIITGITYTYTMSETIELFGNMGIGANIFKLTNMSISDDDEEVEISYDASTGFAFMLQAGVLLHDKYSIDLRYLRLGNHTVTGEVVRNGEVDYSYDTKINVAMVAMTFGVRF